MSELDDLMLASPDHNAVRLAELKRLFPDLFTNEGQLDPQALQKLISPTTLDVEKFRFTWYGKSRARRKAFTPSKGALLYDESRSVNPELADGNMIIEGENLEVLKLLTSAYSESVKCIYIDPPYNTGNDFIYPDNYTQDKREYWEQNGIVEDGVKLDSNPESNGRYHSDWLSMMFGRLLVARLLLKEDGVIFVSIDDNEVHNLRKLMDEVFGEENHISTLAVVTNWKGRSDDNYVATAHEYILMYQKEQFETLGLPMLEKYLREYTEKDALGKSYRLLGLRKRGAGARRVDRPNMFYPFYVNPDNGSVSLEQTDTHNVEVLPQLSNRNDGRWRWGKETASDRVDELIGRQVKTKGTKIIRWDIFQIDYAEVDGKTRRIKPKSIWVEPDVSHESGTLEYKEVMGNAKFTNPKSVDLIKKCLVQSTDGNDIILDFFTGSGTTAQATVELNVEDEGNRKFILVQLPEAIDPKQEAYQVGYRKISDIAIERTKRVIEGYGEVPQLFGNGYKTGFKVYRLARSRFPRVTFQPDPDKNMEENVAALKQYIHEKEASMFMTFERDAVFDEVLLKQGFKLNYSLEKQDFCDRNDVFLVREAASELSEGREALICLDTSLDEATVATFKTNRDHFFICLERALNSDKKWALKHYLGEKLKII